MKAYIYSKINKFLRHFGYEVKAISQIPKRNLLGIKQSLNIKTIIDAGANIGQFATWMRSEFPEATIHSFEPIQSTFEQLERNAEKDPKWHSYNLALSDSACEREINFYVDQCASSSFLEATSNESLLFPDTTKKIKQRVTCTTLDKWDTDLEPVLENDILLKMDVQGYEITLLKGATQILSKIKAVITEVNIENLLVSQASFIDLVTLLAANDLHFIGVLEHGFSKEGRVIAMDAVFIRR